MVTLTIPTFQGQEFLAVLPALALALGAIALMLSEVFLKSATRTYQALLAALASAVAGAIAFSNAFEPPRAVLQGYAVLDPMGSFVTTIICLATGLSVLVAQGFLRHRNAERGEFYALMLFAAAGMALLSISAEFITLFINLEVLSIATYALTAYLRRGPRPAEAGFKYFILGAFSAALLLYGAALLYGVTGTTRFMNMGPSLAAAMAASPAIVFCGLGLVGAGFAFKVAAVPFHMWTPDVYEGAPTPVTALMSAGVKAAAFVALVRAFLFIGGSIDPKLPFAFFSALAVMTVVAGNLMAIPQRNVKRMLAYSSIAHAGYLLMGVAALFAPPSSSGPAAGVSLTQSTPLALMDLAAVRADAYHAILFYLLGYTVTAVGAFGIVAALERREDEAKGNSWDLERFAGLSQRRPWAAAAMATFMLSLGGIPPTVGFLGKLLLFKVAIDAGMVGLAVVGILASAAGVSYYLRVVVYMYMRPSAENAQAPERHWTSDVALASCAALVVLWGVLPGRISDWLSLAGMVFGSSPTGG